MNFRPLHSKIVVELDEAEQASKGGIIIPETARESEQAKSRGTIVAIGPGRVIDSGLRIPMNVAPGDRVMVPKYVGADALIHGKKYRICCDEDVVGIFDSE